MELTLKTRDELTELLKTTSEERDNLVAKIKEMETKIHDVLVEYFSNVTSWPFRLDDIQINNLSEFEQKYHPGCKYMTRSRLSLYEPTSFNPLTGEFENTEFCGQINFEIYDTHIAIDLSSCGMKTKAEDAARFESILIAATICNDEHIIADIFITNIDKETYNKFTEITSNVYKIENAIRCIDRDNEKAERAKKEKAMLEVLKSTPYFKWTSPVWKTSKEWYRIDKVTNKTVICTRMYKRLSNNNEPSFGEVRHIKMTNFMHDLIDTKEYTLETSYDELING